MVEKEAEDPQADESQVTASVPPEPEQPQEEKPKAAPRKRSRKRSAKPKPQVAVPADGTLLREDGDPVVYVMGKGQRRPFADLAAFHACCGGGATIIVLSPKEIDPITVGPEVTGPADLQ